MTMLFYAHFKNMYQVLDMIHAKVFM